MIAEDDTKIVVESSANCNMNPRIEQSVVTVSDELFEFYNTYLHEMFDEEQSRRNVREILKMENDEYFDSDKRIADVGQNNMG